MKIPTSNKDRFVKVRPMFDCVLKRCRELVKKRDLSIDEQIVPFTGHKNVKQYCKGKPNPWGIKIFMLCGASGVIHDFIIYQGSETEFCPQFKNKFGLGASVFLQLTEHVEENKHFYSSIIILLVIICSKYYCNEKYLQRQPYECIDFPSPRL